MKKYLFLFSLLLLQYPIYAYADSTDIITNPLGSTTFAGLLDKITTWMIKISAPILVIVILYGAFLILTAVGNENKFKQGKQTILYAVIGIIIVLVAKGLVLIIKQFLGVKS